MFSPQNVCYFKLALYAVWKQNLTQGDNKQRAEQRSILSSGHSDPCAQHYAAEMLEDPVTPTSEITLEWTHYVCCLFFFLNPSCLETSLKTEWAGEAAGRCPSWERQQLWAARCCPSPDKQKHSFQNIPLECTSTNKQHQNSSWIFLNGRTTDVSSRFRLLSMLTGEKL